MSKHDFPEAEFLDRLRRLRDELSRQELDWLVVIHPTSIHWLIGSDAKSYQSFQCLLVPAHDGPLALIFRQSEEAEVRSDTLAEELRPWGGPEPEDPLEIFAAAVREFGLEGTRIGLEVPAYYLHPHHYLALKAILGSALVAEPTNLVADLKMVKSAAEIEAIREAAAIADKAIEAFAAMLRPGTSELELAGEVTRALLGSGSGVAASTLNLVSGDRACFSHGMPTRRMLRAGDFGNIEFGATVKRYTATIGRNFALGEPTARMVELHEIVRSAGDAVLDAIRPGISATAGNEAARRVLAARGLDHGRVHTVGYGLAPGFPPSWGEPISMYGHNPYKFAAGMVLSIEPPCFLESERLGARLIDNALVGDDRAELLTGYSRDLIIGRSN